MRIGYETFGFDGPGAADRPTVVFVPIDTMRAQPGVEGAGAVPRPALPRRHDRPAAATAAPDRPTYSAAYDDLEFVADTVAVMDHLGVERAMLVGDLRQRLAGAPGRRTCTPTACRASSRSRPWVKDAHPAATPGGSRPSEALRRGARRPTRAGALTNRHVLARRLAGVPASSSSTRCCPSRTRPSSSRTSWGSPARPRARPCSPPRTAPTSPRPSTEARGAAWRASPRRCW